MNKFLTRLTIPALALALAAPAFAQWGEWYVAPSVVYNDDDPDRRYDDSLSGLELAVGRDFVDWVSFEGRFAYSDINGYYLDSSGNYYRAKEPQVDLSANVLAFYDRQAGFAPFAMVGVGYQKANLGLIGKENNPTASLGAGFKWRFGDSQYSLRTEIRSRWTFDGGNRTFNDFVATIGLQYSFGAGSGRPTYNASDVKDTDGDGVLDMWDECPDTPAGVDVTARGCEVVDMTRDTDGDRVPDYRDECPDTPTGAPVDPQGCSLDSDMDGVLTGQDRCPASRPGADVDEFGCEEDSDKDGVLNQYDECPNTRAGARVDARGCEIRDVINLPGVNFGSGSDILLPGFEQLLMSAAATLNKYPELKVEVAGHTDDVGDATLNQGLSERRAKTVLDHLVNYGVDPSRLTYRGYGESQPVANNTTVDGRAQNRRVELRITSE